VPAELPADEWWQAWPVSLRSALEAVCAVHVTQSTGKQNDQFVVVIDEPRHSRVIVPSMRLNREGRITVYPAAILGKDLDGKVVEQTKRRGAAERYLAHEANRPGWDTVEVRVIHESDRSCSSASSQPLRREH
jgi:hypothetical protein